MKTVFLPIEIVREFISLAKPNTDSQIETCGILAGRELPDCFLIDTLIVPKQEGFIDRCFMIDEIGLFEC